MGDKVLVVDDELLIREVLAEHLSGQGYELIQASSGEEAIELARDTQFHAILLDMGMSGIDGMETCRRLKAEEITRRIPAIMMTGLSYEKEAAVEAGADDFISKPPDFTELAFRLKSISRIRALPKSWRKLESSSSVINDQTFIYSQICQEFLPLSE